MSLASVVEKGIECVKKERELMSKMLECLEKGNQSKFALYTERFRELRNNTDSVASFLLENYGLGTLEQYLKNIAYKRSEMGELYCQTFHDIVITLGTIYNKNPRVIGTDCMSEEHSKELLDVYLWGCENENMSTSERKHLHDFMLSPFTSSRYVRYYFSGDYKAAENLSNPNRFFGANANSVALQTYYIKLNNMIGATNSAEMYDSFGASDAFNARRRYYKYQLMTINNLMEKRGIEYPVTKIDLSDFTRGVVMDASSSVDEYKKTLEARRVKPVIYL